MNCGRWTLAIGLFVILLMIVGVASYAISEGWQRAYYEMVRTDGGAVIPAPKSNVAAFPPIAPIDGPIR
jgi:hypothetical protein